MEFDLSYLQLCGDTENFSNPPADVHNLFQGQVEVHTVRYCNVPLPRGGLISQPLSLFSVEGGSDPSKVLVNYPRHAFI